MCIYGIWKRKGRDLSKMRGDKRFYRKPSLGKHLRRLVKLYRKSGQELKLMLMETHCDINRLYKSMEKLSKERSKECDLIG